MTSNDKDFRFMATNDLMVELQKDSIKLDDDSERKVRKILHCAVNENWPNVPEKSVLRIGGNPMQPCTLWLKNIMTVLCDVQHQYLLKPLWADSQLRTVKKLRTSHNTGRNKQLVDQGQKIATLLFNINII